MTRQKTLPEDGYSKLSNSYITSGAMARLDPSAWKVLCVLVARSMGKQSCWPSVSGISHDSGVSDRHVIRCIGELEREGLVTVEKRAGANTVYTMIQAQTHDTMSPLTPCHPCHDVTPTHDTMSPPPMTPCHPNKTKSKKTNQQDDTPGLFTDDTKQAVVHAANPRSEGEALYRHFYCTLGAECSKSAVKAEVTACHPLVKQYGLDICKAAVEEFIASQFTPTKTVRRFASVAATWIAKAQGPGAITAMRAHVTVPGQDAMSFADIVAHCNGTGGAE